MNQAELLSFLDSRSVAYERYEHPAVFTCVEADALGVDIPGAQTKNLFLRNKRKDAYYLVSVPAAKRVDIAGLSDILKEPKLSFASPEDLLAVLGLAPGSVSPFGLVNDSDKRVRFIFDRDLVSAGRYGFHPNDNTATLVVDEAAMRSFLSVVGHVWSDITVPARAA